MKPAWFSKLKEKERAWRHRLGSDISSPKARRRALIHFNYFDHAILRVWWKNFHQIDTGVYRSNQPSPERLAEFRAMGIKTILNLRGSSGDSHYLFEREACISLGLTLIDHRLYGADLASRRELLDLISILRTIAKPVVMHCKSGSDRTGFAAVIYLHVVCGRPLNDAMRQLHWRYFHLRHSKNGILDLFFEAYLRDNTVRPISLPDWIATVYNPVQLRLEFAQERGKAV